jgi:ring-1,2-phenylacetyl-CoA epoxidase subunit PaaC
MPDVMAAGDPLFEYLLRLGDNGLILGHRVSEWCGHGPVLEEDLALANVALDLLGQAKLWLALAGEVEGNGRDADQLAFLRDVRGYRNLLLVEQKNGDFAVTMTRQFFFDAWHHLLLRGLQGSSDARIAEIADKSVKEVAYHLERSRDWMLRLGDGTEESHRRVQKAIDTLWSYTGEMFEADGVDEALLQSGVAIAPTNSHSPWLELVDATLEEATLQHPEPGWMQRGGKRGLHSEHLGYLLAEMQFLQRAYPGAKW